MRNAVLAHLPISSLIFDYRTRKRKEAGEGFGIFCDLQPQSRAEEKRQLAAAMELSLN